MSRSALKAAADALASKLSAVEEELYQVRNRSNQDPLNFSIKLNNLIAALRRSIETGDGKPTEQSFIVFKELSARLDAERRRLDEVLSNHLAAFNRFLSERKFDSVRMEANK